MTILHSRRVKNPPDPAPGPTPHVGPFVMSVEFPTPKADEPTHRIPYEEVQTIEEAVAWILHPPFPPEALKKLKKGVLLTARMQAEWVQENGQHGEEIAAMGLVLRVGTRNVPTKIAVVTRDGASVDGERVRSLAIGRSAKKAEGVAAWLDSRSTTAKLLMACEGVPRPLIALAACAVARTVLHLAREVTGCARAAVETAEAWAYGRATPGQVEKAERDVWDIASGNASARIAAWATRAVTWPSGASAASACAWNADNAAEATHADVMARAKIVREWIGTPEAVFAVITEKK